MSRNTPLGQTTICLKLSDDGQSPSRRVMPERRSPWIEALLARRPTNVVLVAMANKTARVVWAMLSRGEAFRADAQAVAQQALARTEL